MATYYVSQGQGASDSNDGLALAGAFATLSKAASVVGPGDTVIVAPGLYRAAAPGQTFTTAASGTAAAPITWRSLIRQAAAIFGQLVAITWQNSGDYNVIDGFELFGVDSQARLGIFNNASHCTIQNCKIHDYPGIGAYPNGGAGIDHGNFNATNNDTLNNLVYNCGGQAANGDANQQFIHGIYYAMQFGNCFNNICYGNGGGGIHMFHGASDINCFNNLCFNNLTSGIIVSGQAGQGPGVNDHTIVANNILIGNGSGGGLEGAIYETQSTGANNQYKNNLLWNNSLVNNRRTSIALQNGLRDSGTIYADPRFLNYQADGSGDYHVLASSPAIGAGVTGGPTTDYDGRTRANPPAIGPYEYVLQAAAALVGGLDLPRITIFVDRSGNAYA